MNNNNYYVCMTTMMMMIILHVSTVCAFMIPSSSHLTNIPTTSTTIVVSSFQRHVTVLSMSLDDTDEVKNEVTTTTTKSVDGTFYDDEVDPIPVTKVGISDTMKQRLINEASTGLDSDKAQNNVILYIIGIVAVLVLLGGKDILY